MSIEYINYNNLLMYDFVYNYKRKMFQFQISYFFIGRNKTIVVWMSSYVNVRIIQIR